MLGAALDARPFTGWAMRSCVKFAQICPCGVSQAPAQHPTWFTEVTQQSLDVVSFDDAEEWSKDHDERTQFEPAAVVLQPLLGVAVGALLDVDLKRAFHQLCPRTIWSFDHSSASQLDAHEVVWQDMQALLGDRRPQRIAHQSLASAFILSAGRRGGMQRKAHLGYRECGVDFDARLAA